MLSFFPSFLSAQAECEMCGPQAKNDCEAAAFKTTTVRSYIDGSIQFKFDVVFNQYAPPSGSNWTLYYDPNCSGSYTSIGTATGYSPTFNHTPNSFPACYLIVHCYFDDEGFPIYCCKEIEFSGSVDPTCCELTYEFNTDIFNAEWDFGDGSPTVIGTNVTHTYWDVNTIQVPQIPAQILGGNLPAGTGIAFPLDQTFNAFEGIFIGEEGNICADRLVEDVQNRLNPPQRIFDANSTSDSYISVRGNLRTDGSDGDYTFLRCDFCMHPSSTLSVECSGTEFLALRQSHLFDRPCTEEAWFGIALRGSNPRLITNGTHIEGAYNAIKTASGGTSRLAIRNTIFDRNYVGIYIHARTTIGGFERNTFGNASAILNWPGGGHLCDGSVISGGHAELPEPFAGIFADNDTRVNLPAASNDNLFSHIGNGIYLQDADGDDILGCRFWDIFTGFYPPVPGTPGFDDGRGIMQWANTTRRLIETGLGKAGTPTFLNCREGIHIEHAGGFVTEDIRENLMQNVDFGILSIAGTPSFGTVSSGLVENNDINYNNTGIWFNGLLPASDVTITKNRATSNTSFGTGAEIERADGSGQYIVNVIDNMGTDGFYDSNFGVRVSGSDYVFVANNTIEGIDNAGIQFNSSTDCYAKCNSVSGPANGYSRSLHSLLDDNNYWQGNETTDNTFGVEFTGTMMTSNVTCNDFGAHFTGLQLGAGAIIDDQGSSTISSGNEYIGPYNGNIAANAIAYTGGSPIFYKSSELLPYTVIPNSNIWYMLTTSTAQCVVECGTGGGTESQSNGSSSRVVASGSNSNTGIFGDLREQRLYSKLLTYPALKANSPLMTSFSGRYAKGTGAELSELKKAITDAYLLSASQLTQLNTLIQSIDAAKDRLKELDADLERGADFNIQIAERSTLAMDLTDAQVAVKAIQSANLDYRKSLASGLIAKNDAVSTAKVYFQNEKLLYDITLKSLFVGKSISSSALSNLKSIAIQCELDGGVAVLHARALYAALTGNHVSNTCLSVVNRSATNELTRNEAHILIESEVRPNPASGLANVVLDSPLKSNAVLQILNTNGTTVRSIPIVEGIEFISFEIGTLPNGTYFYKILSSNNSTSGKFVVLH